MPLYDYRCGECARVFELLVKSSEQPACPECGCMMDKLVSRPAAPGQTAVLLSKARKQAAKEGHFSHYSPSERPRGR